jgi:DNA processing protein
VEYPEERLSMLALSYATFLTPREKLVLIDMLGGARPIFRLSLKDMASLLGRRFITREWDPERLLDRGAEVEKILTAGPIGCIFYGDQAYPPQLREIFDPPATLFFRGRLPDNARALIGIVGTRLPTGAARKAAFSLGFELCARGIGVVSGLARGIDREAHEGCVEAGGYSVAVLGNGIDFIYPSASRATAMGMLKNGGLIVSEYPPGIPPLRYNFPARNRIISGLCRSVIVVQAPEESGALITAEYALEQGRDLFVHRAGMAGGGSAGTRRLAESGAPVIDGSRDVLRDWGIGFPEAPAAEPSDPKPDRADEQMTGEGLARLVSEEIAGLCARKSGQTFRRG